jgi:hypothetical protein
MPVGQPLAPDGLCVHFVVVVQVQGAGGKEISDSDPRGPWVGGWVGGYEAKAKKGPRPDPPPRYVISDICFAVFLKLPAPRNALRRN